MEDTLLAEAGEAAEDIEMFRGGKAEHNAETLENLLGPGYDDKVRLLQQFGFLEPAGANYKIPMIYRYGLEITQGKAFATSADTPEDDEI